MHYPTLKWMLVCAILSLGSCTRLTADSYCQVYTPIVVSKGDGNIVASSGVKKRILANELTYRDQCRR